MCCALLCETVSLFKFYFFILLYLFVPVFCYAYLFLFSHFAFCIFVYVLCVVHACVLLDRALCPENNTTTITFINSTAMNGLVAYFGTAARSISSLPVDFDSLFSLDILVVYMLELNTFDLLILSFVLVVVSLRLWRSL